MKVLIKCTIQEAQEVFKLGFERGDKDDFYGQPHTVVCRYIDKNFFTNEEIAEAQRKSFSRPELVAWGEYKQNHGLYYKEKGKEFVSTLCGNQGRFYSSCAGNACGWSAQLKGFLFSSTRHWARAYWSKEAVALAKKVGWNYLETGAPKGMLPWETKQYFLLRTEGTTDLSLALARKGELVGQAAKEARLMLGQ